MKRANIEFMIGWLDALRRDDLAAVTATLARDIVWQGLREEWACHGPEAVGETFAERRDASGEIEAIELIGAERHAIVHIRGGALTAVEDIPLPDGIYNVFTLDNGTVLRVDDYAEREQGLTAAGLPG